MSYMLVGKVRSVLSRSGYTSKTGQIYGPSLVLSVESSFEDDQGIHLEIKECAFKDVPKNDILKTTVDKFVAIPFAVQFNTFQQVRNDEYIIYDVDPFASSDQFAEHHRKSKQ
ncbi:hypothetical protein AGMMS50229_06950 [Campylobacterota bacterium]|nr:hypothetical protein AGMMS50229_06950 [Campylobacterota bacterium]